MRKKKIILSFVAMILISAAVLFLVPSNAKADTFYNKFIEECEGEKWFISYVNEQFLKDGKRLSSITNENDSTLLSIKTLSFPDSGITKLPKAVAYLKNVEAVDLASNSLSDISALYSLKNIKTLDLSANKLRSFDAGKFASLEWCDISYNSFGTMPDFSSNKSLKRLYMTNCSVSSAKSLDSLTKLEVVDLSYNFITDCSALGKMAMSSGELDLSYNQIKDITFLAGTTGIAAVNLSYNFVSSGIAAVPQSVKTLSLKANGISDSSKLSTLKYVENLDASSNGITSTAFLTKLTALKTLDLSENKISTIPELVNLVSLTILDLSHNQLSSLPVASLLTKLVSLDVSYNSISSAALANKYQSLMHFDISHNNIDDIGFVSGMTKLSYLDASYNKITSVSSQISLSAGKLTTLDLSGNSFSAAEIKNIMTNNFAVIKLYDCDLSGKIPDMTLYPGVKELYLSRSKLSQTDINNILKRSDYIGLGLGGNVDSTVISKLADQTEIITLDLSGTQNLLSFAGDIAKINCISLDISNCSIQTFDERLLTESMKKINLSGNNIASISDDVLKKAARNSTRLNLRNNPFSTTGSTFLYLRNMFDYDAEFGVAISVDISELKVNKGEEVDIYSHVALKNVYTGENFQAPAKDAITLYADPGISVQPTGTVFTATQTIFDFDKKEITVSYMGASATISVYTSEMDFLTDVIDGTTVIYGFDLGSTFGDVISALNLPENYTATVTASDGTAGSGETLLQTGGILTLSSGGKKLYEATVLIYGDCSGDGKINSTDFMMVKRHIFNQSKLEGIYFEAVDVYRNGSINSTDFMTIKRHIFRQSDISQTR